MSRGAAEEGAGGWTAGQGGVKYRKKEGVTEASFEDKEMRKEKKTWKNNL